MEFIKREWLKLSLLAILLLISAFGFIYFHLEGEKRQPREETNVQQAKVTETIAATSSAYTISSAITYIYKTYSYGPGVRFVGADEHKVLFAKPHETEGCNSYTYINLKTGEEVDTTLPSCPNIPVSESYPFYISDCSFANCYDYKSLEVTNLLTLEKKIVPSVSDAKETTIKNCTDGNYGPICKSDIYYANGYLTIPVYKVEPRKPYEIYSNAEPTRKDTVDLFKIFKMERLEERI